MRDEYPIKGTTQSLQVNVEASVAETIKKMAEHTKMSESELANTALKRFIATHKDFLPASAGGSRIG